MLFFKVWIFELLIVTSPSKSFSIRRLDTSTLNIHLPLINREIIISRL